MQNQHQILTAPLLLPVTEAKEAQGTSQSSHAATGRTSVLSTEIRAEEASQHISPAVTFCTLQFRSPGQPENAILVPEAGRCTQLATSLRSPCEIRVLTVLQTDQKGVVWAAALVPSPAGFGDDHLRPYLMKLHPETHVLQGDRDGALRVGLQAGGSKCVTWRFNVYQGERKQQLQMGRRVPAQNSCSCSDRALGSSTQVGLPSYSTQSYQIPHVAVTDGLWPYAPAWPQHFSAPHHRSVQHWFGSGRRMV